MEDVPEMSEDQIAQWFSRLDALIAEKHGNTVKEAFAQQVQTEIAEQCKTLQEEIGNNARFRILREQTKQRFPKEWNVLLSAAGKSSQRASEK